MKKLKPYVAIVKDTTTDRDGIIGEKHYNKNEFAKSLKYGLYRPYAIITEGRAIKLTKMEEGSRVSESCKLAIHSNDWFEVFTYTSNEMLDIILELFADLEKEDEVEWGL